MKDLTKYFFLFFLSCICNSITYAQVYNFKTYNEDNGLPQNYIYSITQNKDGFLNLSTGDGFSAFGGNKFKTFTIKDSLCENFTNIHFEDSRGIVWLGHYQNGITYLKNYLFSKVKNSNNYGTKITSFAEDKEKNIWFTVQGKGVYYIDTAFKIQTPELPADFTANTICIDSTGTLLCGTDEGIYWFDLEKTKKPRLICTNPFFENKSIKSIIRDKINGNLFWASIQGEGIYGISLKGNCYLINVKISAELNSESINILNTYSDNSGNLWISLADEGIKKILFTENKIKDVFSIQNINKSNGLQNLYVQSILEDFEGNMWFGTFGGGLIQLPVEKFNYYKPEINSDIKSILMSADGSFWIGTTIGLIRYNITNEKESILYDDKNGLVSDKITALFQDENKTIWIGTQNNGVYTLNPSTNKFENFSKKNKLSILTINCFEESKEHQILIGTDEGVYFVNHGSEKIVLITTLEGLLHNNVRNIFCDSKKRTWLSSNGTPPYFLENNEFTVLQEVPGLKSFSINSVSEDNKGLIWIASEGDGIFSYDGKNTLNYTVNEGMLSNYCYSVIHNNRNETWVTHKNGLSIITNSGKTIRKINKSDGLLFNENNTNATFKDTKGDLWFGTTEGLVKYHSENGDKINITPRTRILSVTINDKSFYVDDEIKLPYKEYTVRIDFIGISLTDPSKVNYKYRLIGFDTTWRYTSERFIEFPKIADGKYTFQVFSSNNEGVWTANPSEIEFEIGIPVWKKVWFWVLLTTILGTLVYFFVKSRIKGLLKIKEKLESSVKEKTFQLQIEKEQLESVKIILEEKNKDITDSINYAKRIQEALLPSKESFLASFQKSFVYFKPRDIVSGDFYWFAETEEYYIIAAVDCTGHGIPGAFMSIIGTTILTDIVIDKKITLPSEILNQLSINIIKLLKQNVPGSSSRDGMDVSICSINKLKTKMHYSSASRPMYYVREGILNEVNLRSYSIGGSYEDLTKTYTDVKIDLLPDDIFYLFTDGYADQFDSNDYKKFSGKALKKMCIEISTLDPEKQLEILDNTFNEWKGDTDQIDDVTIIGIKI